MAVAILKEERARQAQQFVRENKEAIQAVEAQVDFALQVLAGTRTQDDVVELYEDFVSTVRAHLQASAYHAGALTCRKFLFYCVSDDRRRIWAFVDALGALSDATGTRWEYLSMEQRHVYLRHATENLAEVFPIPRAA